MEQSGKHFDPAVVAAFLAYLDEHQPARPQGVQIELPLNVSTG
jgi:HD-GYP domain-containing protein (c-di-GMP phosphodiesterase class II)